MPGMIQPRREIIWHDNGSATFTVFPLFGVPPAPPRTLSVTKAQYEAWQAGAYIQDALPQLSASDREFLISGATDEMWDELFKEEDD